MTPRTLDWVSRHDPRSRSFSIAAVRAQVEPISRSWRTGPVLDQRAEGACFPSGTLVRLADGSQRPIEEVRVLDRVVTAEGETGRVLETMVRRGTAITRLALRGHNYLRATPEHPVLARRNVGSRRRQVFEERYIAIGELQAGDFVAVTRYLPEPVDALDVDQIVNLRGYRGTRSGLVQHREAVSEVKELPSTLMLTPALGRLLGLYAAEGSCTPNKVVWTFGRHEAGLVQETVDLIKTVFDAVARVQHRPNNCSIVVLYGKPWLRLFQALVPGTAKHGDKHLSSLITAGPPTFLRAVLSGWQDGDGHRRRTSVDAISVCHRLAVDMHAIANGLGLRPTINASAPVMNRHAATRQNRWAVTVAEGGGANMPEQSDTAVWRRVISATTTEFDDWVFNLHVEGDESYVAEGIGVHNCVGFGCALELSSSPIRIPNVDDAFARRLYVDARAVDQTEHGADWPEGASVLAGAKVLRTRGYIAGYRWAFSVEELRSAIITAGPAILGLNWYDSMYDTDEGGMVEVSGDLVGGHCILAYGYSPAARVPGWRGTHEVFRWQNSWGLSYGVNGRGVVRIEDMDRLLAENGESCIPVGRDFA